MCLNGKPGDYVQRVDWSETPELQKYADRVREVGNKVYPEILRVLEEDPSASPRHFDVVFKKSLPDGHTGTTRGDKIYLNMSFFLPGNTNAPPGWAPEPGKVDMLLVHEMGHVAQAYWHFSPLRWTPAPNYWIEGVSDYARFKLGYTNEWSCPKCAEKFPHFTSGYCCAAAFLLFLDERYGSQIVRELNTELRGIFYSDSYFLKATGKSLEELWLEFKKTPAFDNRADKTYKIQRALGYRLGRPPKNLDARFRNYVRSLPGGRLTLEALVFLEDLRSHGALPGFDNSETIWMDRGERGELPFARPKTENPDGYPATRWFYFYKPKEGRWVYQYIARKNAPEMNWQLIRAWRSGAEGKSDQEFQIP
jgi:hypothetical protein